MIEAKEEVITTRFTLGADFLIDFKMPVVPIMAGSRSSFEVVSWLIECGDHWCQRTFWTSVTLKWNGLAVWMTASKGGSETTALSKAFSWAMSSTMAKSSLSEPYLE
jgi:hypothetical protein